MSRLLGSGSGVLDLPALTITKILASVGADATTNCYLLQCKETGAKLMIDAAGEPERLVELCDGRLDLVVTTHRHWDHWELGLAEVVRATSARTYAGAPDVPSIEVPTDVPVEDGDHIAFGAITLTAIRLTGHTPGSVALLYEDPDGHPHLFTGDSLFPGGPGRTTNPTEFTSLMDDLEAKVFGKLPDDTVIWPGHGKPTTLGAERPSLPAWRARGW